jgi:hypothetical protein
MRGHMQIPTSIIELDEGGFILRYAFGGRNGRQIRPDLGLMPGGADCLDLALREIAAPDRLLWQESGIQDPSGVFIEEEEEE